MATTASTIIRPQSGWQILNLREIWQYRDLLYFLSLRGIKIKYAQSVLGVGWAIANPLIQAVLFTVVFGQLAKLESNGVPYILFSYTAMVTWTYFSGILSESTNSLINNRDMISKVYFPRLILPLAAIFSRLVDFSVAFLVLVALLIYYGQVPSLTIFMFPVLLLMLIFTSVGVGSLLAAIAVQYRDVKYAMEFLVRLLMYTAPVVYPVEYIPEAYRQIYALNPMVGVIEGMRSIFLGTRPFPYDWVAIGGVVSIVFLLAGSFYFRRTERHFADLA